MTALYQWLILQKGQLPLSPTGQRIPMVPHACTATLVWPIDEKPTATNAVLVDPCFFAAGVTLARTKLDPLGVKLADLGTFFVTHGHYDHIPRVPLDEPSPDWVSFVPDGIGLQAVACPGHHPDLQSLVVPTAEGEVWIVSDAILNRDWLLAWKYYWPNGYDKAEIIQTWRSVALILSRAKKVIPGHGPDFDVTDELLDGLIEAFPKADHADECPDVLETLRRARSGS